MVDNIFSFNVAVEIFEQDKDLEPRSIKEWRQQDDWYKLKEATKKFDFTTKAWHLWTSSIDSWRCQVNRVRMSFVSKNAMKMVKL